MPSVDYHIELYAYLQTLTGKEKIKECDEYIANCSEVTDNRRYIKEYIYNNTKYKTLPTYIRNAIDHPDNGCKYTYDELEDSIRLLIKLCNNIKRLQNSDFNKT